MTDRTIPTGEADNKISIEEGDDRLAAFDLILVPHPRIDTVKARIKSLMRQTKRVIDRNDERSKKAGGRAIKLEEMMVLPIIGPSGATKSKCLSLLVDEILQNPDLPADQSPIIPVTVKSSSKTPKALQLQILAAFGDKKGADIVERSKEHSEGALNKAILELARPKGTLIVALDEAHNMLIRDTAANANVMANALKSLVNDGLFALVLLGTQDALHLFANTELTSRKKETVNLGKFDITSQEDRDYFFGFAGYLEEQMLEKGVVDRRLGLIDGVTERAVVYDMAGGVVGIVPRVLRIALERAFEEERGHITWDDVANGLRGWKRLEAELLGEPVAENFFDPFDPQNGEGGAKWSTIKQVNKDFPADQQLKKRTVKAKNDEEEEETV